MSAAAKSQRLLLGHYVVAHNAATLSAAAGWMSFGIKDHLLCGAAAGCLNANLLK
jgi:hypothetical protein